MTILQDGRERAIECDECPTTTDPMDRDDFDQMIQTARNDGWEIKLVGGEWVHRCPGCRNDGRLARAQKMFGKLG